MNTVSRRLIEIGKMEEAADMYLSVDNWEGAIDTYISIQQFGKAKTVAQNSNNPASWFEYIKNAQTQDCIQNNRMTDLSTFNRDAAIEMYVHNDDWDQVYQLASAQGEQEIVKFASIHAKKLVGKERYAAALGVLTERGVSCIPANFSLYRRIAQEILAFSEQPKEIAKHPPPELPNEIKQLREMLYKLCNELRPLGADSPEFVSFERMSQIAHFIALKIKCQAEGIHRLEGRIATSLLRYTDIVPVDKAFYEAGYANLRAGIKNMGFVFLNRFVDVSDLIEDPDNSGMDNSDFVETDIPLADVPLPPAQSFGEDLRDEAREWVLDAAMSNEIDQSLNQRQCGKCSRRTYEAALTCHNCQDVSNMCFVTGYPIPAGQQVSCGSCGCTANREDWNLYIGKSKVCPWCGNMQQPQYNSGL